MITCPWCGTSFREFQSSCARCGGPLPAEVRGDYGSLPALQSAEAFRSPPPPPPPRRISSGYAFRLFFSDGWGIVGFVFLILGVIYSILGMIMTSAQEIQFVGIPFLIGGLVFLVGGLGISFWRFRRHWLTVRVLREGVETKGTIEAVTVNYAVKINGQSPWTIRYSYYVLGRGFEGKIVTLNLPGGLMQKGMPVCILYLPESPGVSSIYPHP